MSDHEADFDEAVRSIDACLQDVGQRALVRSVGPMVTSWTLVLESMGDDGNRKIGIICAEEDRTSDSLGHVAWADTILRDHITRCRAEDDDA